MSKSAKVEAIKDTINRMIAAEKSTPDGRIALSIFLADLLLKTDNYNGFNYLGWTKGGGYDRWKADGEPKDITPYVGDETRKEYY